MTGLALIDEATSNLVSAEISKLRQELQINQSAEFWAEGTQFYKDVDNFMFIPSGSLAVDGAHYSPFGVRANYGYFPDDQVVLYRSRIDNILVIIARIPDITNTIVSVLDPDYADANYESASHESLPTAIRESGRFGFGTEGLWDSYAGELMYTTALGGRLGLSQFSAIIAASPVVSLEMFKQGGHWKSRHIFYEEDGAANSVVINPTGLRTDIFEEFAPYYFLRLGENSSTGYNQLVNTLYQDDPGEWEWKHPIWTRSRVYGESVGGEIEIFRNGQVTEDSPNVDSDPLRLLPPTLKITKHQNGIFAVQAREAILFSKACYISDYNPLDPTGEKEASGILPHTFSMSETDYGLFGLDYNAYVNNDLGFSVPEQREEWDITTEEDQADGGQVRVPTSSHEQALPTTFTDAGRRYFLSQSFVGQLPDGSILLSDGYGSEIVMSRGNITITCPGHILAFAGNNLVFHSGNDSIIRSNGSVDVTSGQGDVRLRAYNSMQISSGSSGSGGILIEDKSSGAFSWEEDGEQTRPGGIVLKSPVLYTYTDYMFTENTEISEINYGRSVLYKADRAGFETDRLFIKVSEDRTVSVDRNIFYVPTEIQVDGQALFTRDIITSRRVLASLILSVRNRSLNDDRDLPQEQRRRYVNSMKQEDLDDQIIRFEEQRDRILDNVKTIIEQVEEWSVELPESEDVGFSYRTVEDYGSSGFRWKQPKWQAMLSGLGGGNNISVQAERMQGPTGREGGPWPGPDIEDGGGSYVAVSDGHFDRLGLFCYNNDSNIIVSSSSSSFASNYIIP